MSGLHFVDLVKVDNPTRRALYTDLRAQPYWPVRTLRETGRTRQLIHPSNLNPTFNVT